MNVKKMMFVTVLKPQPLRILRTLRGQPNL